MDFKQIELAIELSQTLNYRKTAENHFISQPSLTYQMKRLESEIGVPLFKRSSTGVSLTTAGSAFCQGMRPILEQTRQILSDVRNCGACYGDMIRVGLNGRRHRAAFVEIARRFSGQHPDVFLNLIDIPGQDRLHQFRRHELDAVFFMSESIPESDDIDRAVLVHSRIYAVMRSDHPLARRGRIAAEDLRNEFILLFQGKGPEALIHAQEHLIQTVPIRSQLCASAENAVLWIEARNGIALMPGFCYDGTERFSWIPFEFQETISCGLAWYSDLVNPFLEDFVRITMDTFRHLDTY